MASYAGIFDLPQELFDNLMSDLDYDSVISFRQTCRLAATLVPLDRIIEIRKSLRATLLAEEHADRQRREEAYDNQRRWASAFPQTVQPGAPGNSLNNIHLNRITRAERLNCYACLKHLPRECFVKGQVTGRRSLGHADAGRRFCKVCGVKKGIWDKGSVVKDGRAALVFCRKCNSLERGEAGSKKDGLCSMCLSVVVVEGEVEEEGSLETEQQQAASEPGMSQVLATHPASAEPSSRATRCLRCWAINHTEVSAGSTGSHLCPPCEAAVRSP